MDPCIHHHALMYALVSTIPPQYVSHTVLSHIFMYHIKIHASALACTHIAVVFFGKKVPAVLFVHTPLDKNTVSLTCMGRDCHAVISI